MSGNQRAKGIYLRIFRWNIEESRWLSCKTKEKSETRGRIWVKHKIWRRRQRQSNHELLNTRIIKFQGLTKAVSQQGNKSIEFFCKREKCKNIVSKTYSSYIVDRLQQLALYTAATEDDLKLQLVQNAAAVGLLRAHYASSLSASLVIRFLSGPIQCAGYKVWGLDNCRATLTYPALGEATECYAMSYQWKKSIGLLGGRAKGVQFHHQLLHMSKRAEKYTCSG